jgi:peptide/nickel transport system permease protein
MRQYILRRLLLLVPIMVGVSFLTYATFNIIPGDAAVMICGLGCTEQVLEDVREELGLDRPWYEQYGSWLGGVVQGDLGESYHDKSSVASQLERRLPITVQLMIMATILSLILGIIPGVLSAVRPNSLWDLIGRFTSVLWLSIPSFYLGLLVLIAGASWFGWSPPQYARGYVSPFEDPWVNFEQFLAPSLVLAFGIAAVIMRLTRSSMLEVLRNEYIRTAWSKGLRERTVVFRHALKNAMIPVFTIVAVQVGLLISGSVIVENVFNLQGVGFYLVSSIVLRDLPVVQSLVLIFAATFVLINLLVDVGYAWLDPRIRYA